MMTILNTTAGLGILTFVLVGVIIGVVVVFIIQSGKRPEFLIFDDEIVIKDFLYPAKIPNYTIKSVRLLDAMPKVILRMNGYALAYVWKGFFRIKNDENKCATLYLERNNKAPFIEINTVNSHIYINLKNEEETKMLFNEMQSKIKYVREDDLVPVKVASSKHSIVQALIFTALIVSVSLLITII